MASPDPNEANYPVFRECVSSVIVTGNQQHKPSKAPKRRAKSTKRSQERAGSSSPSRGDPEELAEFIDFIASELFTSLPQALQTLSYSTTQHDASLATRYSIPLARPLLEDLATQFPPSITDSLATYSLVPDPAAVDPAEFLNRVLTEYIAGVTRPPPVWATTRTDACEICERDWIPLSYHHLIPRGVHAKVLKKGWHDEWMLNSVAWLCRACHSFVHRMASNEELAREWFTVERILEREDVRDWARWVGRVRWKAR